MFKGNPWRSAQVTSRDSPLPINAVNQFSDLNVSQEYDPDMIRSLNQWADKVQVVHKRSTCGKLQNSKLDRTARYVESSQRSDVNHTILVRSEKDVNKIENVIAAIPRDRKGYAKTVKKIERVKLKHNERLMMVDSGSFEHAIDAEVELPDHDIEPPSELDMQ